MLNQASLEPKKFHVIECPKINSNYNPANIEKYSHFPIKPSLTVNNQVEAFQIFYER